MDPEKLTTDKAAEYLGISGVTLTRLRKKNEGPDFYRIGGKIFYKASDLDDYREQQRVSPGDNEQ